MCKPRLPGIPVHHLKHASRQGFCLINLDSEILSMVEGIRNKVSEIMLSVIQ